MGRLFASSVVAMFLGAASVSAATLNNGDFETGNLSGWTVTATSGGGTQFRDVFAFDTTGAGASNSAEFRVGQTTDPTAPGGIILSQEFTVSEAGLYDFSADVAANARFGPNASGGIFRLIIDGVLLDAIDFGAIADDATERGSLAGSLSLGLGVTTFAIEILRPFSFGSVTPLQYVDNASIEGPLSVVPLPATLPFLLVGLGSVALVARRRQGT